MQNLFRAIPSVDKLLKTPRGSALVAEFGHHAFVDQARSLIEQIRHQIQQDQSLPDVIQTENGIFDVISDRLQAQKQVAIKKVFNLTGTVLHTNLGRGLWSQGGRLPQRLMR